MFLASPNYIAEGLRSLREEHFFCMWLNSSFSVLQLISATSATRGSWARVERFTLDRVWVPDYHQFSEQAWERSEKLWAEIGSMDVASLLDQVSNEDKFRVALDGGLLMLCGVKDSTLRAAAGSTIRAGIKSAIVALRESMGSPSTPPEEESTE
jgi:hypothetical protein